eukprot:3727469-Pyramimonas_sp.AAC.1
MQVVGSVAVCCFPLPLVVAQRDVLSCRRDPSQWFERTTWATCLLHSIRGVNKLLAFRCLATAALLVPFRRTLAAREPH